MTTIGLFACLNKSAVASLHAQPATELSFLTAAMLCKERLLHLPRPPPPSKMDGKCNYKSE